MRVEGLGFRVWGLGFRELRGAVVSDVASEARAVGQHVTPGLGHGVEGFGLRVED